MSDREERNTLDRAAVRQWLEAKVAGKGQQTLQAATGAVERLLPDFDRDFPAPPLPRCHYCGGEQRKVELTGYAYVACNNDSCDVMGPKAPTLAEAIRLYERPVRLAEARGRVEGAISGAVGKRTLEPRLWLDIPAQPRLPPAVQRPADPLHESAAAAPDPPKETTEMSSLYEELEALCEEWQEAEGDTVLVLRDILARHPAPVVLAEGTSEQLDKGLRGGPMELSPVRHRLSLEVTPPLSAVYRLLLERLDPPKEAQT